MKENRFFDWFLLVATVIGCIIFTSFAIDGIFFTDKVGWTIFYSVVAILYGIGSFFCFRELRRKPKARKSQDKPWLTK